MWLIGCLIFAIAFFVTAYQGDTNQAQIYGLYYLAAYAHLRISWRKNNG